MLRLLGSIHGKITDLRNDLYDRGIFKSYSLGARTISIGNITTGGTGKTPLVAYVAEILADAGEKVCILTRGYGREDAYSRVLVSDGTEVLADAHQGGDEPVELARKLIGKSIVVADADRVSAAKWAKEKFGTTVFVLDDGFQHRRAKRDLDIVCIDATDPCGSGRMLPAGRLREPFRNLQRADAIVLTRANLVDSVDTVIERIRRNSLAPLFAAMFQVGRLTRLTDFLEGRPQAGKGQCAARASVFCALGNPASFLSQLEVQRVDVITTSTFADHHFYDQRDISAIEAKARSEGAETLITTAKDAVKLNGLEFTMPCFVAGLDLSISEPEHFQKLITSS